MWSWLGIAACTISPPAPTPREEAVAPAPNPSLPTTLPYSEVSWTLRFPERALHRVQVELSAPCPEGGAGGTEPGLTLWMAAWTPGSYLIRDYARWVEGISAGERAVERQATNRWRVACAPGEIVTVRYRVVAASWSVREAFVDQDLAALNPAALFLLPEGQTGPFSVRLELPSDWTAVETQLPMDAAGVLQAESIDALLDSPMVLGDPVVRTFSAGGVEHRVVLAGETEPVDADGLVADLEKMAPVAQALWGEVPYPDYRFLWLLGEQGSGGLEHSASTLMTGTPWATHEPGRDALVRLAAHELLHAWNGKRLRPVGLGPFDYERPVQTPSLWLVEGVTSYYDDLVMARAGLLSEEQVLASLSQAIRAVQEAPGRSVQSLAEASRDAWTGYYRQDADSDNRNVDYYDKGAVVAWLLDARLRRKSGGRSLDDLVRALWREHRDEPYQEADVQRILEELSGPDDAQWLADAVFGTEELDYGGALQWFGLSWEAPSAQQGGWLGPLPENKDGRLLVTRVLRDTPAASAGLSVGDEVIALGGYRVTAQTLPERLKVLGSGWTGELLVARRGRMRTLTITLGSDPGARWSLSPDPGASPLAVQHRRAWLGGQ